MNIAEIKQAVDSGHAVHWSNKGYRVIKDSIGQYLIEFHRTGHCIGLTWLDGVTLNGKERDFFTSARWHVAELYRDYANNFLTVRRFAEYYGLDVLRATRIIRVGKYWHNRGAAFYKQNRESVV